MEDKEIMSFRDEDGNKVDFEAIARIYVKEKEYLLLAKDRVECVVTPIELRMCKQNVKD